MDVQEPGSRVDGDRALVRLRLNIAYDGTDFFGWAVQPSRRTVAGVLHAELERLFGGPKNLTVAGRTDAGVHAIGQVCHVDVPADRWEALQPDRTPGGSRERSPASLIRRLAGLLPLDVRVTDVYEVPLTFDARFSALWRRYEYRLSDEPAGASPLRRLDTVSWRRPVDLDALNEAAQGLVGEHNFVAFCKRKEHATTIRHVTDIHWVREADGILVAFVRADAFCQSMVRSLVGAMVEAGDGRRSPQWPSSLLSRTDRSSEVRVMPPHGLSLVEVGYPDDSEYAARAELTRRLRA